MILVMSGTADGRELVKELNQRGIGLITTVTTSYGKALFKEMGLGHLCVEARLDGKALLKFIEERGIDTLIDATHPYAATASRNAIEACKAKGIQYIRLQREETPLPGSPLIHKVKDLEEAVEISARLGKRILLTTGFSSVKSFFRIKDTHELVVRILPMPEHIKACLEMGLPPQNILALQGPFSKEFNKINIREFNIDVVVTKDGGREARTLEKVEACLELGIPIVIIQRPELDYPVMYSSINKLLKELRL